MALGTSRRAPDSRSTRTDEDGHYWFETFKVGRTGLVIDATDHAPAYREIEIDRQEVKADFRLEPARTLRGRIVTRDGEALAGAWVSVSLWKGHDLLDWRTTTGEDGAFVWRGAPNDEVKFEISAPGHYSIRDFPMTPREDDYVIAMMPELDVSGSVIDAKTGQSIPAFDAILGMRLDRGRYIRYRGRKKFSTGKDGGYRRIINEPRIRDQRGTTPVRIEYVKRIEAPGYRPAISRAFYEYEGNVTLDFELEKMDWKHAVAVLPSGQPAPKARVVVHVGRPGTYGLRGTRLLEDYGTTTKEDGSFSYPPPNRDYAIDIRHTDGCAWIGRSELDSSTKVTLVPWASIEGRLSIGGVDVADQSIIARHVRPQIDDEPYVRREYFAHTGEQGEFTIDRVVPGEFCIGLQHRYGLSHTQLLSIEAGQHVQVSIGEGGRHIKGRLRPGEGGRTEWAKADMRITLSRESSLQHRALMRMQGIEVDYPLYRAHVRADGSFEVYGVPPGSYRLSVNLYPSMESGLRQSIPVQVAATAEVEFVVPGIPEGQDDEPLDIGTVEYTPSRVLHVGDVLPPLELRTMDGETIRLKDLNGGIALLHFWTSWCEQSAQELPTLKQIYERYGQDSRLLMLGLSGERHRHYLEQAIGEMKPGWPQCLLHGIGNEGFLENMRTLIFPPILIVGQAGMVIATPTRSVEIIDEVEKALGG